MEQKKSGSFLAPFFLPKNYLEATEVLQGTPWKAWKQKKKPPKKDSPETLRRRFKDLETRLFLYYEDVSPNLWPCKGAGALDHGGVDVYCDAGGGGICSAPEKVAQLGFDVA